MIFAQHLLDFPQPILIRDFDMCVFSSQDLTLFEGNIHTSSTFASPAAPQADLHLAGLTLH